MKIYKDKDSSLGWIGYALGTHYYFKRSRKPKAASWQLQQWVKNINLTGPSKKRKKRGIKQNMSSWLMHLSLRLNTSSGKTENQQVIYFPWTFLKESFFYSKCPKIANKRQWDGIVVSTAVIRVSSLIPGRGKVFISFLCQICFPVSMFAFAFDIDCSCAT